MAASAGAERGAGARRWIMRLAPFAVIALAMGLVYAMGLHQYLSLETLVKHRNALDEFISGNWPVAVASYVGLYVAAVAMSFPGALLLTISGGVLFGCWVGSAAAVLGATAGAALIFTIASSAFGGVLARRAGPIAAKLAAGFRADAFSYMLFLRLVPVFPFWLVNLAAALVGVRLTTFVAATAIGIIPGTVAYSLLGAGLDSVIGAQETAFRACLAEGRSDCRLDFDFGAALTPQLIGALVALGLVALIPVVWSRLRGRRSEPGSPA